MTTGKTILVCGGRDYADRDFVYEVVEDAKQNGFVKLVHGGAAGADALARDAAGKFGLACWCYKADWITHGRAAGPIRNQKMLDNEKPDLVVAFPGGRGTADMVRRARSAGVRVIDFSKDDVRDDYAIGDK